MLLFFSMLLILRNNALRYVRGYFFIMARLDFERAAAPGQRAQVDCIPEHLRLRDRDRKSVV